MSARAELTLERILARAMTDADPSAALSAAAADRRLAPELRAALRAAVAPGREDGVRMAALLVARLRFERLIRGSPEAERWFDRDPADFTQAFRRYHQEVPPTAFFPAAEGRQFQAWLASGRSPH